MALWPTACSSDDDALTFFFAANPEEADARLRVVEAFQRRHPDIKVRTLLSGPDALQHVSIYCAGGKCPDVLMAWEFTYSGLAERGVLLDLNTMLAHDTMFASEIKADSVPSLYETFTYNGGQYAFPEQWSGNFLFYNKDSVRRGRRASAARAVGRAVEFRRVPRRSRGAHQAGQLGPRHAVGIRRHLGSVLLGPVVRDEQRCPVVGSADQPDASQLRHAAFIDGIQFYADLANRYRVAPNASEAQSMATTDLFTSGHAAMALGGHWRYQTLDRAKDLDFDIAVLPTGPKGHAAHSNIGTTGLAIAASSPRKKQAWEFVKFAAGPVGQAVIAESGLVRAGADIGDPLSRFCPGAQAESAISQC